MPVGTAYAWHDNDAGQLGIGSYKDSNTPVPSHLPPGTTCIAVAGGQSESLFATSVGSVYATGYANRGQLGDNSTVNVTSPVQTSIPPGVRIKSVAAGWDDAFALSTNGAVYSWGWNIYGQLGVGTTGKQSNVPVLVHMPSGVRVKAIAAGKYHVLALTSTGGIYAWGSNAFGQLGDNSTTDSNLPVSVQLPVGMAATAIGAGDGHSLAVTA
ncbi:MAG: RCC1 domain-containing protein, partial [Acidimicrobiales bacterium]